MTTTLGRLAGFCYRQRWAVTLGWLVIATGLLVLGFTRGAPTTNDFSGGDSDSARAGAPLTAPFPDQPGPSPALAGPPRPRGSRPRRQGPGPEGPPVLARAAPRG